MSDTEITEMLASAVSSLLRHVRRSGDHFATCGMAETEPARLRRLANEVEARDADITAAKSVLARYNQEKALR